MIMQIDTKAIDGMDRGILVQRQMDGKGKFWESVHGSWQVKSCTYIGIVKKYSCIESTP